MLRGVSCVAGCVRSAVAVQPRVDDSAALLQLDSTEMEVAAPAVAAGAAAAAAATPAAPIEGTRPFVCSVREPAVFC
jgi:hypothetical protein